jgi:adenine deaminase
LIKNKKMNMSVPFEVSGNIIDVVGRRIFHGTITVKDGIISDIRENEAVSGQYILPGLIDAHIHIESSMLIPSEFARLAVIHGTVATVSDPHEIGNVLGIDGVRFMIENGRKVPFKFFFGAPSCVPATSFETSGAAIGTEEVEELLKSEDIYGLSEMMNVPGVLFHDPVVMQKLALAKKYGKPVDGHAPGLTGEQAKAYISAGITTDHECFTVEEAIEKIGSGMKVLIREGSAAKNFDTLAGLITRYPDMIMFCSDDKHPNDLAKGHINELVKRALGMGIDPITVIRCCTYNPVQHYHLNTGLLQKGDPADFIVINNLEKFNVKETYIDGQLVSLNGKTLIPSIVETPVNIFITNPLSEKDIKIKARYEMIRVIKVIDAQLITKELVVKGKVEGTDMVSNIADDILKIVVLNRYSEAPPAVGFIAGFGLKEGAIASSIAHDSHNIIAIGVDDHSIIEAINLIIDSQGGISLINKGAKMVLPLPYAGIMTNEDGFLVSSRYEEFDSTAKTMGSMLAAPFMTLSFMALLVIPEIKLSDKGLFDGNTFRFTELFPV